METNAQKESEKPKVNVRLENLGTVNKNKVVLTTSKEYLVLFFSYQTIVSFHMNVGKEYNSQTIINAWGTTTGKLLNELCPDKSKRIYGEIFKEELAKAFNLVF